MTSETKKTIVILGGGFGGMNTAATLHKLAGDKARIVLVDRNNYHLYHPTLYEVATSEEDFTSMQQMKHSVALPFNLALPKDVETVQGEVEEINQTANKVKLAGGKEIPFDYLVVALGSVVDCFGNKGLEHYCIHLKTLRDALFLRNEFEFAIQQHRQDVNKKLVRFIIGGGGFSGVELAGELRNLAKIMSWKYSYPLEKIEILVVEGAPQLLPGMPADLSKTIYDRLKQMGVEIRLGNLITDVTSGQIKVSTGEMINYDVLIWTGGVRSVKLPFAKIIRTDAKDRAIVDEYLRVSGTENIFAIGDNALIFDHDKRPLPGTATQAIYQAQYVARELADLVNRRTPQQFKPTQFGYIIPVSGKWAVLHLPMMTSSFYGFFGWMAHRYADFRYFRKVMPTWKAFQLAWTDTKLYSEND